MRLTFMVSYAFFIFLMLSILSIHEKCYKAAIVLRSYNDRLVDLYDGPTLFQWLSSNLARKNIIKCGASGLCFKREIVVGVTQSICFLSCNDLIPKEMRLDILCRTQGKDLNEFTFRQGSNIAISILGNIAIEAAGLAYKELHDAAASLHKEKLWALLSSTISSSNETPSSAHVTELLDLCSVNHISNFLDNSADTLRFVSIFNNAALIDFTRCCTSMKRDHTFLPSWELAETEGLSSHLFYLASEDLFLLVKGNKNRTGLLIYLVEQEETPAIDNRATGAIQKLANFLLHFLWSETRVS